MVHSAPLHDLVFGDKLKAIVRVGAGVNTIPVDRCTENGIAVFNTPGGNANAVKELAIAAIVSITRNVEAASSWVKTLKDSESEPGKAVEKGKEVFRGPEIMGKRIGIIGVGSIGSRMAKACSDLGMDVIGYAPTCCRCAKRTARLSQFHRRRHGDLQDLRLYHVHVPLNDETRDYIRHDRNRYDEARRLLD
jgi:D-3-phosphoglycerate dehydrogenase